PRPESRYQMVAMAAGIAPDTKPQALAFSFNPVTSEPIASTFARSSLTSCFRSRMADTTSRRYSGHPLPSGSFIISRPFSYQRVLANTWAPIWIRNSLTPFLIHLSENHGGFLLLEAAEPHRSATM